jgi:hypothetical protein
MNPHGIIGYGDGISVQPEDLQYVMTEMLREQNVEIWLHTNILDVLCENEQVKTVIVSNKSGIMAMQPKVVIDCTGDADIVAFANVPFRKGREPDGAMQPASVMFEMENVDVAVAKEMINTPIYLSDLGATWDEISPLIPPGLSGFEGPHDQLPFPQGRILFFLLPEPNHVIVNMTRVLHVDGTSGKDVSAGEIEARRQIMVLVALLKTYVSGFKNAVFVRSAQVLGVRQTRNITGPYMMTAEDVQSRKDFIDTVAYGSYPIDIHNPDGKLGTWKVSKENYYHIPYRALVPEKMKNLLVAGRCINADHFAMSSVRIMGTCMSTGQAAGMAAAIAAETGKPVGEISSESIIKRLKKNFSWWKMDVPHNNATNF